MRAARYCDRHFARILARCSRNRSRLKLGDARSIGRARCGAKRFSRLRQYLHLEPCRSRVMHSRAATAEAVTEAVTVAAVILAEATSAISGDAEASASTARRTTIMVTGAINGAAYGHRTAGESGAYMSATTDRRGPTRRAAFSTMGGSSRCSTW